MLQNKIPNNIVRIPCTLETSFFKHWFLFLKPFHNLTNKEIEVIASFAKYRYELSKVIKDDAILDKVTLNEDTRKKVMEECKITSAHFQVIMGKLRKNKMIVDGKINRKFIPNIREGESNFQLLLLFDMK